MEPLRRVEQLCQDHHLDYRELAVRANLDEQRVLAIMLGRWTPSPQDRDQIAAVFGLTRHDVIWGHKTPIQHIYGHGPT